MILKAPVRVNKRFQITIPREVRRTMRLKVGDTVEVDFSKVEEAAELGGSSVPRVR